MNKNCVIDRMVYSVKSFRVSWLIQCTWVFYFRLVRLVSFVCKYVICCIYFRSNKNLVKLYDPGVQTSLGSFHP